MLHTASTIAGTKSTFSRPSRKNARISQKLSPETPIGDILNLVSALPVRINESLINIRFFLLVKVANNPNKCRAIGVMKWTLGSLESRARAMMSISLCGLHSYQAYHNL